MWSKSIVQIVVGSVVVAMCIISSTGQACSSDWTSVRPQVSSEAEVLAQFGSPDEIIVTFPWAEWSAKWKKRPRPEYYVLRYNSESATSLLTGPAGKADDVEVEIGAGKVVHVRWHYGGPSAMKAAAIIRADPNMSVSSPDAVCNASKPVPGGWIWAELGPRDSSVQVSFMLK